MLKANEPVAGKAVLTSLEEGHRRYRDTVYSVESSAILLASSLLNNGEPPRARAVFLVLNDQYGKIHPVKFKMNQNELAIHHLDLSANEENQLRVMRQAEDAIKKSNSPLLVVLGIIENADRKNALGMLLKGLLASSTEMSAKMARALQETNQITRQLSRNCTEIQARLAQSQLMIVEAVYDPRIDQVYFNPQKTHGLESQSSGYQAIMPELSSR